MESTKSNIDTAKIWQEDIEREWGNDSELEFHCDGAYLYLPSSAIAQDEVSGQLNFCAEGEIIFTIVEPPNIDASLDIEIASFEELKAEVSKWNHSRQ